MKKLITICLLFFVQQVSAQTGSIRGTITDASNDEALIGVTVSSGAMGTISDDAGNYLLSVAAGNQTVKFSFVGYDVIEKQVVIKSGDTIKLNIQLLTNAKELGTIVVSS
ncbi:MAG: carboxypeptidase-like regulatory domain-containing protein, partial [Bacteroidota bacterium]